MDGALLLDFADVPHQTRHSDLADLIAPHLREYDPEWWQRPAQELVPTLARKPSGPYRLFDNRSLMQQGLPEVHELIRSIPDPYREVYRYLETEYGLMVPSGMDDLGIFMVSVFQAHAIPFSSTPTVDVYATNGTVQWTKPSTATLRFASFILIGGGGPGGGGARVTTSGNQAAGGGGGGGGGTILRTVTLASLSTGNVVVGTNSTGAGVQSTANTNGLTSAADGNPTTFASLTAGGGSKGTGGTQGAGAQTGAFGAGGTGDFAGTNGGTGRSGATVGDDGVDQTTNPSAAGGAGGGGATADTAQANSGRGGRGWWGAGLHGTVGGGALGTAGGGNGSNSVVARGEGSGGGGGSDQSGTGGGTAGDASTNRPELGGGGGGGGGRARNAATTAGNGGAGGNGGHGHAQIVCF